MSLILFCKNSTILMADLLTRKINQFYQRPAHLWATSTEFLIPRQYSKIFNDAKNRLITDSLYIPILINHHQLYRCLLKSQSNNSKNYRNSQFSWIAVSVINHELSKTALCSISISDIPYLTTLCTK